MTARVFAQYCPTCGTIITEITPSGHCPICRFYGWPGWLTDVDDRGDVMPWVMERAILEPVRPLRRVAAKPTVKTPGRRSILDRLRGKTR
jgi:hypothetical protein